MIELIGDQVESEQQFHPSSSTFNCFPKSPLSSFSIFSPSPGKQWGLGGGPKINNSSMFYPNKGSLHYRGTSAGMTGTKHTLHVNSQPSSLFSLCNKPSLRYGSITHGADTAWAVETKSSNSAGAFYTMSTLRWKMQFYLSMRPMEITSLIQGKLQEFCNWKLPNCAWTNRTCK